ncbi:MAG: hypothetical protein ACJ70N_01095 [Nitrososphaera sp.]
MVQKMMSASGYWEATAPSKIYGTTLKNLLMQTGSSNRTTRTENDNVLMTTIVVFRAGNQAVMKAAYIRTWSQLK